MLADCLKKFSNIIFALITRGMFALHVLVAIWRIALSTGWNNMYFLLFIGLGLLIIETIITVWKRKGEEYKWFCPSVFFYLLSIVPCVWLLEIHQLDVRTEYANGHNNTDHYLPEGMHNETKLRGILLPMEMNPSQWIQMVEQLLLFILILGRWMLPKGKISRDELSQLLLVYLGMAADIIEFFEAFKEEKVKYNRELIMTILAIWSASLFQFTLVLTASKSRKVRAGFSGKAGQALTDCCDSCVCCDTEIFGVMTTMILQDGPFLTLRLLLLIRYDVYSYMHVFFTIKNTMVLCLIFYRLFVLFLTKTEEDEKDQSEYIDLDGVGTSTTRNQELAPED